MQSTEGIRVILCFIALKIRYTYEKAYSSVTHNVSDHIEVNSLQVAHQASGLNAVLTLENTGPYYPGTGKQTIYR